MVHRLCPVGLTRIKQSIARWWDWITTVNLQAITRELTDVSFIKNCINKYFLNMLMYVDFMSQKKNQPNVKVNTVQLYQIPLFPKKSWKSEVQLIPVKSNWVHLHICSHMFGMLILFTDQQHQTSNHFNTQTRCQTFCGPRAKGCGMSCAVLLFIVSLCVFVHVSAAYLQNACDANKV